jgi:ubiquinone/menaquinone biosynthesis C-methylase UbiE
MQTIRLDLLGLTDGDVALDLGCGLGRHSHAMYFHKACRTVGLDLGFDDVLATLKGFEAYPNMADETPAHHRFDLTVGNALQLPFADATFDRLICSEVLEHIPDYLTALDEIARVTKPGGRIGISVPRRWPEQICWLLSDDYHNEPGGHVRIFKSRRLVEDFEARGFRLTDRHWAHGLHSPYWWWRCLCGVKKERNWLARQYHKLLVLEIVKNPLPLRMLSAILDPLMGKSVVLYFDRI